MVAISVDKENQVDYNNRLIISDLVENYFWLDSSSLNYFKEQLMNTEVDEVLAEVFKIGPDLRCRVNLSDKEETIKNLDEGWTDFRRRFSSYCEHSLITYAEYRASRVNKSKNVVKLQKDLIDFYTKDIAFRSPAYYMTGFWAEGTEPKERKEAVILSIKDYIRRELEYNGTKKLPKNGDLQLVVSFNFADWFMASTSQNWSSCIGLKSSYEAMYWAGLPGLIGDKNRCIIYLTDGNKKRFEGIEVDNYLSRCWGIYMQTGEIRTLTEYPTYLELHSIADSLFDIRVGKMSSAYSDNRSKHPVELLFNQEGNSLFIYQDYSCFDSDCYITPGESDYTYFTEGSDEVMYGSIYDGGVGLHTIMEYYDNVGKFSYGNLDICDECGERYESGTLIDTIHGDRICSHCYDENYATCDECGSIEDLNHTVRTGHDEIICEHCAERRYFKSDYDGEYYHYDYQVSVKEEGVIKLWTEDQANEEGFVKCQEKNIYFPKEEMIRFSDGTYMSKQAFEEKNDAMQLRLAM